jgi:hypothetical protein
MSDTVAILCAARKSYYHSMAGCEVYDIERDVRTFAGGMPIVAHPPCRSWSAFCAHQAKPLLGEKELGPLCVEWLRECGGVLEHPAHSRLWDHCDLPTPGEPERGGLWSLAVQQSWWGDSRTKNTWLLFAGVAPSDLPPIPYTLRESHGDRRKWQLMSKTQRAATPPAMAEWLVSVARSIAATPAK